MTILKKIKSNLFIVLVMVTYITLLILRPDMGVASVYNSGYYIKEMLMIMPVIFVLTALLDLWVPKEKIMKYLGKESKIKGKILSFVLGSISAGPIYAAFPFCIMLLKKGASIRNVVVILSSWAVIKVPMLLNEVKFLGTEFMAIRWLLTVLAILIFSWITSKIVKDEDLIYNTEKQSNFSLNRDACIGCALCAKNYPEVFKMQNNKASIISNNEEYDIEKIKKSSLIFVL